MARLFISLGLLLLAVGLILVLFPRAFAWFGSLPGDVDIRRENSRVFIPITSMLLLSLGATLIINLVALLLRSLR